MTFINRSIARLLDQTGRRLRGQNLTTVSAPGQNSKLALGFGIAGATVSGLGVGLYISKNLKSPISANTDPKTGSTSPSIVIPPLPVLDSGREPAFSSDNVTVVFVLGGPGVGKGTQCSRLVREFDFVHLSAGDLLREERNRPGSIYGELIEHYIREGKIIPHEITITLLHQAMLKHPKKTRFLIDGFPRSIEQGIEFELVVCPSKMVLFFECPEEEMLKRLMGRSQSSGRSDDNVESIKKRFRTFQDSTLPVREFYNDLGKLRTVNCAGTVDQVFENAKGAIKELAV